MVVGTIACLAFGLLPGGPFGVWGGTPLAALVGIGGAWWTSRRRLMPLLAPTQRNVLVGVSSGLAMAVATHVLYPLVAPQVPAIAQQTRELYARLGIVQHGPVATMLLVTAVVLAEELVFRGIVFGALQERLGTRPALVVAVAIYVLPQLLSGSWLLLVLAVGCGVVWTLQRAYCDNLVVPLLTHLVWDALVMVCFPLVPV